MEGSGFPLISIQTTQRRTSPKGDRRRDEIDNDGETKEGEGEMRRCKM